MEERLKEKHLSRIKPSRGEGKRHLRDPLISGGGGGDAALQGRLQHGVVGKMMRLLLHLKKRGGEGTYSSPLHREMKNFQEGKDTHLTKMEVSIFLVGGRKRMNRGIFSSSEKGLVV